MSTPLHQIVLALTGQTLRHVPPGAVTSATFVLENLRFASTDADRTITSGAATVASWSITSTAAAGATARNARRISTSSTTGAVLGAPVVITGPDGVTELGEVAAISTNSYVELAAPLAGTYAIGSTVAGIQVSCSVPNEWAADEDEFKREPDIRVTWVYTFATRVLRVPERVAFVRHTHGGDLVGPAALLVVKVLYPDMPGRLGDHASLERIVPILVDDVAADLRARRLEPERFLAGPQGRGLLVARIVSQAAMMGYSPGKTPLVEFQQSTSAAYITALVNLVIGIGPQGTAETDTADTSTPAPNRGVTFQM